MLQLVNTDIVNTLFKYRVNYRHLTLMIETFELLIKRCAKFDLLFVNIHCATACSQFKVLYMLNHLSHFNKIHRISCVNTHVQSLKVLLKSVLTWMNYSIFSRLFFIGTPCICRTYAKGIMSLCLPSLLKRIFKIGEHKIWQGCVQEECSNLLTHSVKVGKQDVCI